MSPTMEWIGTLDRLAKEPTLDRHLLDALDELVEQVPHDTLEEIAQAVEARLPERGIHPSLHYLLARLKARSGDREETAAALERLLERLNQDADFPLLVEVGLRNADHLPGDRWVPLLVRAARLEPQAVADGVLDEMLARHPEEPRLHWIIGRRGLAADPDSRAALAHLGRALPHLAREGDPEDLEEAALPVVDALDEETVDDFMLMIAALIERHRHADARTYLELALDQLLESGQAQVIWELLKPTLLREDESSSLRPAALAALARLRPDIPRHDKVIAASGLTDPDTSFEKAFTRYALLMEFPPGGYIEHASWGVGEILDHDGENVTVRFAAKPEHVFKRTLAERALERRDRDDLRVLLVFASDRLAEMRATDPAGLVAVALRSSGGEAKPRDLKRLLSPAVVPAEEWSDWWKKARKALEDDGRIDLTQSFRDLIRLADMPGAESGDVPLPNLEDRGDVARQLKLLRRFLMQHPDARARTGRAHSRRLERWLVTRRLSAEERILALMLLAEWDREAEARLRDGIAAAARSGFSLAEFPEASDQERLLTLGLSAEDWPAVATAGLDSKQPAIRERAIAAIEERLGPQAEALYRSVLEASPARGDAVVEVMHRALEGETAALKAIPAADLFVAALRLLSDPERETLRKQAQVFLDGAGPLFARLSSEPADGPAAEQVELALLNFHASDRYLFPILASLEQIWGPSVIEVIRRRRERESKKIAARMDDEIGELPIGLMTRASFDALRGEMERVDLELRTTIPRAIQKARELGDLRENGEYESAKLKQRQASERLALLMRQLAEAQVIEDLPIDESRVVAGTEVTLEPVDGGSSLCYWVLGDGDSRHGSNVISYRADLGRVLWRRRPGEEVDLPLPAGMKRVRIGKVIKRLPGPS